MGYFEEFCGVEVHLIPTSGGALTTRARGSDGRGCQDPGSSGVNARPAAVSAMAGKYATDSKCLP